MCLVLLFLSIQFFIDSNDSDLEFKNEIIHFFLSEENKKKKFVKTAAKTRKEEKASKLRHRKSHLVGNEVFFANPT